MPTSREPLRRLCVLLPTYEERDALPLVVSRLRAAVPEADILVLDDASPDGTGEVADALAAADHHVTVSHRAGKAGLGRAYLDGFARARAAGYDAVVQIDADGSHQPEQLPSLIAAAADADVVIGSRWVPGGSVRNWPRHRKALSLGGNLYARRVLGITVRDSTAGFRVYRLSALQEMDLHQVASQGYCFQVDLTLRALDRGLRVVEVPIEFVEREFGDSKMSRSIVIEALIRTTLWGIDHRLGQLTGGLRRAIAGRRAA